jgi:NADPH oxidase
MGQFVFLNVPDISAVEWHPFSISSAPDDQYTTHHIHIHSRPSSSSLSWTQKLANLVQEVSGSHTRREQAEPSRGAIQAQQSNTLSSLQLNVDGPCRRRYGLTRE